jgi:hypothetical protein
MRSDARNAHQRPSGQVKVIVLRLDYISCVLTILSTLLIGRKFWQGWMVAGANSVIVCVIAARTAQFGFIPANLFCIALYSYNVWNWRSPQLRDAKSAAADIAHP